MPRGVKKAVAEVTKPAVYEIDEATATTLLKRLAAMGFKKLTVKQVITMAAKPDTGSLPETYIHQACRTSGR